MKKSTMEISILLILCLVGGMATGLLKIFGFEYDQIACVWGAVIWANITLNKLNLDMDK